MYLQSGTRLGVYEIVSPLGAGGMGEVYRARDTRLDRTVALKVLPARFGAKTELRERFEREARVVSNLNHPNICALYDVGHDNGVAFFVMEYIEGQSLADRIAKGPLPLDQVLRAATDVAGALAKAHRHGIVHRDLKPGNVMLTKSGAKLLDFGLARSASSSPVVMPDDATVAGSAPLTAEGTILGTLQYMSPEQLEGGEIDARSDIFAFGAVLYEMVTGQRAFSAASHASLITKIMSEQPRPAREVQPVTPVALERMIERCLRKDPDDRWQCAGDLVAELRAIAGGESATAAAAAPKRNVLPWALAALLLAATAVLAYLVARKPASAEGGVVRFSIGPPSSDVSLVSFEPLAIEFAVSPAGDRIAFCASGGGRRSLWVRSLTDAQAKQIKGVEGAGNPFWSPDGQSIAFADNGRLQSVDLETGAVRPICDVAPGGEQLGTWSPEGTIVFTDSVAQRGIYSVPANGGTPKMLFPLTADIFHAPQFLDDGKRFLFTAVTKDTPSLWLGSLAGEAPKKVADGVSRVSYVAPYVLFVHEGTLMAQRLDHRAPALTGPRVPLATDVRNYARVGGSAHAAGGRTVVVFPFGDPGRARWMDRTGQNLGSAGPDADYYRLRISPDGRKAATLLIDRKNGLSGLWMLDIARRTLTRTSHDPVDHEYPVWSPDGKQIVFSSDIGGLPHLFIHDIATGAREELTPAGPLEFAFEWLEDGRILYISLTEKTRFDIKFISRKDKKQTTWLQTQFTETYPRISPDRKWIVFQSDESGTTELYAAPVDRPREAIRLTTGGGRHGRWRPDGREIYFWRGMRDLYAVSFDGAAMTAGEPVHLFTLPADAIFYEVAADGRFLIAHADERGEQKRLNVIVNWQAEVERAEAKP